MAPGSVGGRSGAQQPGHAAGGLEQVALDLVELAGPGLVTGLVERLGRLDQAGPEVVEGGGDARQHGGSRGLGHAGMLAEPRQARR